MTPYCHHRDIGSTPAYFPSVDFQHFSFHVPPQSSLIIPSSASLSGGPNNDSVSHNWGSQGEGNPVSGNPIRSAGTTSHSLVRQLSMLNVMKMGSLQVLFNNPCFVPRQAPAGILDHLIDPALLSDHCSRNPTSRYEDSHTNEDTDKLSGMSTSRNHRDSLALDDDGDGVDGWGATNQRETTHPGTMFWVTEIPADHFCRIFLWTSLAWAEHNLSSITSSRTGVLLFTWWGGWNSLMSSLTAKWWIATCKFL